MSSEGFGRALMEVGGGLEKMADNQAQSDRDQANYMRDMSMQRLRGKQGKENAEIRATAVTEAAAANREFQGEQGDLTRKHQKDLAGETNAYQDRRLTQQRIKEVDALGAAALKSIDMQISKLDQMLHKAKLESMGGVDDEAVKGVLAQREQLQFNRINQSYRNIAQLKALGDDRYKDMDEEKMAIEAGYSPQQIKDAKNQMMDRDINKRRTDADVSGEFAGPYSSNEPDAAAPVAAPTDSAATPARQIMSDVSSKPKEEIIDGKVYLDGQYMRDEGQRAGQSGEFGEGAKDFMGLYREKPWIKNPKSRELMGLAPLEGQPQTVASR